MHRTDAARLKRHVPQMAKSHQCKVNGDIMQEIDSNELESHVNFQMPNFKEYDAHFCCFPAECQHSIFVTTVKKFLFSGVYKRKNDVK